MSTNNVQTSNLGMATAVVDATAKTSNLAFRDSNISTTVVAEKLILSGVEIKAGNIRPRSRGHHYTSYITPSQPFTSVIPVENVNAGQWSKEYINVQTFCINTLLPDEPVIQVKSVSAHQSTQFICSEDLLKVIENIYQTLSNIQNISVDVGPLNTLTQKIDLHGVKLRDFEDLVNKQTHNMTVLHTMLERQVEENKRLKKKLEELEADLG